MGGHQQHRVLSVQLQQPGRGLCRGHLGTGTWVRGGTGVPRWGIQVRVGMGGPGCRKPTSLGHTYRGDSGCGCGHQPHQGQPERHGGRSGGQVRVKGLTGTQQPHPSSQPPTLAPNTLPPHPGTLHPHSLHCLYPPALCTPTQGCPWSDTPSGELGVGEGSTPGPPGCPAGRVPACPAGCVGDLAGSGPAWLKIKEGGGWLPRLPVNQQGWQLGGPRAARRGGLGAGARGRMGPPRPLQPGSAPGTGGQTHWDRDPWGGGVGCCSHSTALPLWPLW